MKSLHCYCSIIITFNIIQCDIVRKRQHLPKYNRYKHAALYDLFLFTKLYHFINFAWNSVNYNTLGFNAVVSTCGCFIALTVAELHRA